LAGFLILPAMFVAQAQGEQIFTDGGALLAGPALIFQVLPSVFDQIGGLFGLLLSVTFFLLLSIAALTSTISLLEVPVSYTIDELGWKRKSAALKVGLFILLISLIISFNISLIDHIDFIFSTMGLPIGGLLISIFVGYVWKTSNAVKEIESGHENFTTTLVGRLWPFFIKVVCPVLIFIVILQLLLS
jgi:NSS family neurotransmitter:Na+ symporter